MRESWDFGRCRSRQIWAQIRSRLAIVRELLIPSRTTFSTSIPVTTEPESGCTAFPMIPPISGGDQIIVGQSRFLIQVDSADACLHGPDIQRSGKHQRSIGATRQNIECLRTGRRRCLPSEPAGVAAGDRWLGDLGDKSNDEPAGCAADHVDNCEMEMHRPTSRCTDVAPFESKFPNRASFFRFRPPPLLCRLGRAIGEVARYLRDCQDIEMGCERLVLYELVLSLKLSQRPPANPCDHGRAWRIE